MSYNGIKVGHIVATDTKRCIGKDNKLPWHISDDLKRFKEITSGGVVIMGRKTFESMECKPLPNRLNIVLTGNEEFAHKHWQDNVIFDTYLSHALMNAHIFASRKKEPMIWIIGGGEIYAQTMQYVDVIEKTIVHTEVDGDVFYPIVSDDFKSCLPSENFKDEKSGLVFHYRKLVR